MADIYTESLTSYRQLNIKVYVLDFTYTILDEISGLIDSATMSIDADSDIRRTMNIAMVLNQGVGADINSYDYYNDKKEYYKGDIVRFGKKLYQCKSTHESPMILLDSAGNVLTDSSGNELAVLSGGEIYISGVPPYDTRFWAEYIAPVKTSNMQYWEVGNPYWFDKYIRVEVGMKNVEYYTYDTTALYDSEKLYYIGDVVRYGSGLYRCIHVATDTQHVQGIPPTDPLYWEELTPYTWANQGVYMINAPSITYNATDNTLSFQAVDLMSKLTGMRNGYLEGMTYQIKAGSSLVGVMRTVLAEQGFTQMVLNTPPISTTPIDINIDIGSTAYDLLAQLRDINPNWEMFFDVNGVFRFQQIPSGVNETIEFSDDVWDRVGLGYNLNTSFEDVKNYVEVVGKQVEADEMTSAVAENGVIDIFLAKAFEEYTSPTTDEIVWYIGFTLGNISDPPLEFASPPSNISLIDTKGQVKAIFLAGRTSQIYYNNEAYFIRLVFNHNGYVRGEFAGYLQPRAIAFENNPDSPFYVGDIASHTSITNNLPVDFVAEDFNGYLAEYTVAGVDGVINLDITSGLDYQEFARASDGAQWAFKVNVQTGGMPISTINLTYGGGSVAPYMVTSGSTFTNYNVTESGGSTNYYVDGSSISTLSNQPIYKDNSSFTIGNTISLDFSNAYILIMQKQSNSLKIIGQYCPVSAEDWETPTTRIYSMPRFSKMVRGVFSGDEYDNIYTNSLALQRAKYELYLNCRLHDTINIDCVPLYWLDVNKVMGYTVGAQETADKWIMKSITTDFSVNGTQSINAMKYYSLYEGEADSLANTTWRFNDVVNWASCPTNQDEEGHDLVNILFDAVIDFEVVEGMSILINKEYDEAYYYNNTVQVPIYTQGWEHYTHRVIHINGGEFINDSRFIQWLKENATQVSNTLVGTRWLFNGTIDVSHSFEFDVAYGISYASNISSQRNYLQCVRGFVSGLMELQGRDLPYSSSFYKYYDEVDGWAMSYAPTIVFVESSYAPNLVVMAWIMGNATELSSGAVITYNTAHGTTPPPRLTVSKKITQSDLPNLGRDGGWVFVDWCVDPGFDESAHINDIIVNDTTLYAYWQFGAVYKFNSTINIPESAIYDIDFLWVYEEGGQAIKSHYLGLKNDEYGIQLEYGGWPMYTETDGWGAEATRTITITGGDDAYNPEFISWLEENAVAVPDN